MAELRDMVVEWASESAFIKQKFFHDHADRVVECARAIADRLTHGGKIMAFGNGGSASDALHVAVEFTNPVIKDRPPLPAIALNADVATLTSLANDFHFSEIFSRQIEVFAASNDILMGFSTSGNSANVLNALRLGQQRGLMTIAITGKDAGGCADLADFTFAVPSHNILRIQECHLTLYHALWDMVHTLLHYDPTTRKDASADAQDDLDPNLASLYPFLFENKRGSS
jgi:D-sedoheptulose 7-phosphate isomerase